MNHPTCHDRQRLSASGNTVEDARNAGTLTYHRDASDSTKVMLEGFAKNRRKAEEFAQDYPTVDLSPGPLTVPWIFKFAFWAVFGFFLLWALVSIPYVVFGAFKTPSTSGVDTQSLMAAAPNPDYYAALDPDADALSSTPSTTLLATHVTHKAANTYWENLSDTQQLGVQAIWLRYARNPSSFLALGTKDAEAIVRLMDMYLRDLGKQTGDSRPLIDRAHLFGEGSLASHAGIEYSRYDHWGVSSFLEPKQQVWFMGSLILPDNPELAALSETPGIMDALKRASFRGQDAHMQWKLENREVEAAESQ